MSPRRRVNVREFRGELIDLDFGPGKVFPVRGDMLLDVILHMAALEDEAAGVDIDTEGMTAEQQAEALEASGQDFTKWIVEARDLLVRIVREETPTAELPPLSIQEIMGIFATLAGAESVADAVVDALSDGMVAQPQNDHDAQALAAVRDDSADADGGADVEAEAPLDPLLL